MSTSVFEISHDTIRQLLNQIVLDKPTSSRYIAVADYNKYLPIMEPWLSNSLQKIHSFFLPVTVYVLLGGGDSDTNWHIDYISGLWGNSLRNVLIPLYIENQAGFNYIEDDGIEYKSILNIPKVNNELDEKVTMTLFCDDSNIVEKTFDVKTQKMELGFAYDFNPTRPHKTCPGGLRVSIIVSYVTTPTITSPYIIQFTAIESIQKDFLQSLFTIFKGQKTIDAKKGRDNFMNTINKQKFDYGYSTAWNFAITMLKYYLAQRSS
jgi:hypothetical protein